MTANKGSISRAFRLIGVAAAILVTIGGMGETRAETTAETDITVTTTNAGTFSVEFVASDGGYIFVGESGETTLSVSALEGATGTAIVMLAWTDDRADGQRLPYTISLAADDLSSGVSQPGGGTYSISASHLAVLKVGDSTVIPPVTLDEPRTIYTSGEEPDAGESSLEVQIRLTISPSTYPTTYTTKLRLEVLHGADGL